MGISDLTRIHPKTLRCSAPLSSTYGADCLLCCDCIGIVCIAIGRFVNSQLVVRKIENNLKCAGRENLLSQVRR